MTVEPGPKRRMSAERRRAQIIDSARAVFARQGYAGSRTREIAAEAGVNEAMLYRHFPSKEELFEASVLESIDAAMVRATANARGISRDLAGSATQIDDGIRKFFTDLADIAVELGPLIGATLFGPDSPVRTKLVERLDALFDVATAITVSGIPDLMKDDVDVRLGMEKIFGALWFTAEMARWTKRTFDREVVLDQLMLTIYEGLIDLPDEAKSPA
ncbi:helix-turn-helix domain-containing protein [Aeromicrobium sp.]|uniref:TetR/AcrR family transcriptional regulator n=1 Tax=Aeromicrobium sp. TaxID=1871063 RepID=UPI0028A6AA00|nr:helix-turn-helix domain-containing protein [Aeromicrobium sp.]